MTEAPTEIPALLLLAPGDNVAVARRRVGEGEAVMVDGLSFVVRSEAPEGFKVACRLIGEDEAVLKHGARIGSTTRAIEPGEVVHLDNMRSDYLKTYAGDAERFTARGGQ
jgi:hypothetical protein